jgi:hypothetical protein
MENERKIIAIDDTRFIFKTNFSGDPERDRFGSDARKANVIIPNEEQARELADMGFNVKVTKPREGQEEDFVPTAFVPIRVNYDSYYPPKVYLVSGNAEPVLLDEETIGTLDGVYVANVNVILNPYQNKQTGKLSLYVKTMYVEQNIDEDPYASRYGKRRDEDMDEEDASF